MTQVKVTPAVREEKAEGWIRQVLSWRSVRNLGELQILTRVSYVMLVLVPLLSGLWQTLQNFLNDYTKEILYSPMLPRSFAAIFFASLFAVIAHLIYQLFAPEEIRRYNLDQFVRVKQKIMHATKLEKP